ncbi:hypothetical protein ACFC5Z_13845 [Streptomyces sp. NPDC056004]|uniref:hypothetical protein n=1 Tax=Streptomyces sp. NPDC056004 TaxID=3345677 RepID=UPI0035DD8323
MTKTQRTQYAREVTQAQAAAADRPKGTGSRRAKRPVAAMGEVAMPQQWQESARQAADVDAQRRHRSEQAVPSRPGLPAPLGSSYRTRNLFALPDEDERDIADEAAVPYRQMRSDR